MRFEVLATFSVFHGKHPWPWIAFDASGARIAFAESESRIATRVLVAGSPQRVDVGPSFDVPDGLAVLGFAIDREGERLAMFGDDTLVTASTSGVVKTSKASAIAGDGAHVRAVAFDRSGKRLWISTDLEKESALAIVDANDHSVVAVLRAALFNQPALHELYTHPQDDAVLLLAACGEDGTFGRVAGWSDGPVEAIPSALDGGGIPAGFVGFSRDGAHVHLAEADELRTHSWPGLTELSSVELADDFVSSFAGAVLGDRIFVDGEDAETGEDCVMEFDRSALRGSLLKPPVPTGMWAGRMGADCIVTVEAKGDPAVARVLRIPMSSS